MSKRRPLLAVAGVTAALVALVALLGIAEDDGPGTTPVLVCIDSTASTDGVRRSYRPDVMRVAREAADDRALFYLAACGANATGKVNWPVRGRLGGELSGGLGAEQVEKELAQVSERFGRLAGATSTQGGTPFGEMLAVAARQCEQLGAPCDIYLFTDGEWADGLLRVKDGVSRRERATYLRTYLPQIADLAGTEVNFVGVGFGTAIGEVRLGEARDIAAALVQAATGEMGTWTVSL